MAQTCVGSRTTIMLGANARTTLFQRISLASLTQSFQPVSYEKFFGKKAEKMAKEEKEAKKTVSIKKDLYAITTSKNKTPMVTIVDNKESNEVSLEDDDFSQFR